MKTITFYSYKGGVGRSLALCDMATRLSELGQKVCVMDFDLDAPGLRFKFKNYLFPNITKGIVDYIYEFSTHGVIEDITDYTVTATPSNNYFENINFISAGDIHSAEYWKKLSMIKWYDLFYSEDPQGIDFFLDLKAQIEEKFSPDFLLIDSRTGITDISGVTLRLLADEVVVLGINNTENLFGCQKIIKSLLSPESNLFDKSLSVSFVLSRVAYTKYEKEREVIDYEKEKIIVEKIRSDFMKVLQVDSFDIFIIHADRSIEQEEGRLQGALYENQPGSVSKDYLTLFERITRDTLNFDERYLKSKRAQIEYFKSFSEGDPAAKLSLINKAISIDNTKYEFHIERGVIHYFMGQYEESLKDHLNALSLSPNNANINYNLGVIYAMLNDNKTALKHYEKADAYGADAIYSKGLIYRRMDRADDALKAFNEVLSKRPSYDKALNARADIYRERKLFKEALADISQAIELNSDEPIYFATLAEIYSFMGKDDEFYLNLSIALSRGLKGKSLNSTFDVYKKYLTEERFVTLLAKYDIDVNDLYDDILDKN